jgi:hypothetical protein
MRTQEHTKVRADFYVYPEQKIIFEKFLLMSKECHKLNDWCLDVYNHKKGYCELFDEIYSETRDTILFMQDEYSKFNNVSEFPYVNDYIKHLRNNTIPYTKLQNSIYLKLHKRVNNKHIGVYHEMLTIFKKSLSLSRPFSAFLNKLGSDRGFKEQFKY